MRVLFSNAPWHKQAEIGQAGWRGVRAGSRWPHTSPFFGGELTGGYIPFPFFLSTAAAMAKRAGLETFIRDSIAMGESYADFFNFVREYDPQVIIMETSTPSLSNDLAIARRLKKDFSKALIIFCGAHFELEQEKFIESNRDIDFTVYGEYETALVELLNLLHSCLVNESFSLSEKGEISVLPEKIASIPNLVFRDGAAVRKTLHGKPVDLASLPWPHRDSLPNENYFDSVCGLDLPQLQIMTSRGCPYGCIFCVWPQLIYRGTHYRTRSPEDVVNEIEENLRRYPYRSIYIDDDTFNINREHVLMIARLMKQRGLTDVPWGIMARADRMTENMLDELKEAGLFSVKYGVESADQQVLNDIGKKLDLAKVSQIIRYTKEIGIKVHLTFTFGLPSDTAESIEETIALAASLPSDSVQFSIATPFPGTKMYTEYDARGWISTKNWDHYDGSTQAVSRTERFTGEQLEGYVRKAYRIWGEAKVKRTLYSDEFKQAFKNKVAATVGPGAKLVLLQSANIALTCNLLRLLHEEMPYEMHVVTHERFAKEFVSIIPEKRVHVFRNTGDFSHALLRDFAKTLREQEYLEGTIIPYTNPTGCGYEEVEKVALELASTIVAGVTMEGKIIR
ncbi:B12-binding domain-containing radical SAM protein [Heliobacterium mobile]|uniref:B12-binding domain-containing radical SAM protein n=1 Tax=Heliobacterium mobile TaxID=28064 RepID=UPI0014784CB6|nr:radical SAM protein [Heliobacterium mobile]